MKTKILLALDGSESSVNAARYVAGLLGSNQNVSVTLFHVLKSIPPGLLEVGSLQEENELHRKKKEWEESEFKTEGKFIEPIIKMLKQAGFSEEQLDVKYTAPMPGFDVASAILEECENGNYDTLAMGKRGLSRIGYFLIRSVAEKVVRHAKGKAVWVVE